MKSRHCSPFVFLIIVWGAIISLTVAAMKWSESDLKPKTKP